VIASINWHSCLFLLTALLACGFSIGVLVSSNVVRMAAYLIVSLASTAGLFILAGATFLGAMQIMIYVGGTLVLLIFGVMLTAQATFVSMKTRGGEWVLGAIVGGSLLLVLAQAAFGVSQWQTARQDQTSVTRAEIETATPIANALVGVRTERLAGSGYEGGTASGYLLPFEIVSIHLLVVLIGAACLARTKRRVPRVATGSGV